MMKLMKLTGMMLVALFLARILAYMVGTGDARLHG